MKTYQEWEDGPEMSIDDYLQPGDEVDEEMYDHFGGVTSPQYCDQFFLQSGEASFERRKVLHYMTFSKVQSHFHDDKYLYLGELPAFKQPK